jgi:DNA-binding NarL/FixJ family response regulator
MDENPDSFLKAVSLGVSGYVLKDGSASDIVAAVRTVAQGGAVCPPSLCLRLMQRFAEQERSRSLTLELENANKPSLTHRQIQLVSLVAKGLTNKEIAASLNLSEFTVKNHMRRILKLVDAQDRYEAVTAIREFGVLSAG